MKSIIRKIISLCKALSVRKSDLIGSAARDDFKEYSDIDVLVVFDGDSNLFDRYFELKENLEKSSEEAWILSWKKQSEIRFFGKVSIRTGFCFMPHDPKKCLLDVIEACELIQEFTANIVSYG